MVKYIFVLLFLKFHKNKLIKDNGESYLSENMTITSLEKGDN